LSLDGAHIGDPATAIEVNPWKIMKHFLIGGADWFADVRAI
jgi:hypothetical protein